MDLNKAMIIGRLTRDPETRTTTSGQTVASFSVATSFKWKDANGTMQEKTEFHNIVAWRKLGEICSQYLKKGKKIYLEGRLQTRDWVGQDGVKRYRTEIIADNMIMLDSISGSFSTSASPSQQNPVQNYPAASNEGIAANNPAQEVNEEEIHVEDIPF